MGIYKYLIVLLVLIFPLSNEVYARPISWSGGSTFMYKTDSMKSSYYYHYSPLYRYSLGVEYVNDRHFNNQYFNLRGTYLLDRENTKLVEIVEHSHDHTHDHSHEHGQEASDVTTV